jgi:hypothetical protein
MFERDDVDAIPAVRRKCLFKPVADLVHFVLRALGRNAGFEAADDRQPERVA